MDVMNEIVALEWEMFQAVNEGGPKASCQEDRATFEGMRRGQFAAWSARALEAYREDLHRAKQTGRNLMAEKYIYMMEHTDPARYAALKERTVMPDAAGTALVNAITEKLVEQTQALFAAFPCVAGAGRPLRSSQDDAWHTSVETYQRGELLTYSQATLEALLAHLEALEGRGESLARMILENSVRHYGYESLEQAETRTAQRRRENPFYGMDLTVQPGGCCGCGG